MRVPDRLRWGILGTAGIAWKSFLPALAEAGGIAAAVASRDGDRAARWAAEHGVDRAVTGYQQLIEDPRVDAVYVPLPNRLHAEWTIRSLRAGKPVLCEKPLAGSLAETEQVLAVARQTGTLLWEAFVFPFHRQTARVQALIAAGAIGQVREIQATFHAAMDPADIRFSRQLAGGALADVGCYPVRLARLIFADEAVSVRASHVLAESGVDAEAWGTVDFPGNRRLLFSCSFTKARDTIARLLGTDGELRLTSPYSGRVADTIELRRPDGTITIEPSGTAEPNFTDAIRHIHAVLRGEEKPRHLAIDDAYGNAAVLDAIRRSALNAAQPVN